MKKQIMFALVAASGFALAGCMEVNEKVESAHRTVVTGHPGGAYEPRNMTVYDLENRGQLVLMDKGVQHSVTT